MNIKISNKKDLDLTIKEFEQDMNHQLEKLEKKSGNESYLFGIFL